MFRDPAKIFSDGRVADALTRRVDIASAAVYRVLFGAMMLFGTLRFFYNGWIERFFVRPEYYLSYWGFESVVPLSETGMYVLFGVMALFAFNITIGFLYRISIVGFFLTFSYVELIDVANYLNHYYLVSLLALLMCFMPLNRAWSVDAKLWPTLRAGTIPAFVLYALRFQVGIVYVYAGLAKFQPDWLLHAQPLNIWLNARVDTPFIGGWLDIWEVALAMSWAGFLYDTSIVFFLLWRKSRPWAMATVVVFHGLTGVFFTIGLFPLIMIVNATLFLDADWPRRLSEKLRGRRVDRPARAPQSSRSGTYSLALVALSLWCVFQVAMPLRYVAYPGPVVWHEQGMRWAWKVMVREKDGSVAFWVHLPDENRRIYVPPRRYLTAHQEREMAGQPDLILRLAHDIGREWQERGHARVEVYADAIASLNGRPPSRFIDPDTNLMDVDDGITRAEWILPAPANDPPRLGRTLF